MKSNYGKLIFTGIVLAGLLLLSSCAGTASEKTEDTSAAAETETQTETETTETESAGTTEQFHYVHDPAENPEAMKDIVVNPDAVYGFSPNPDSTRLGEYASYDWTDPEFVAECKENRIEYQSNVDSMHEILLNMTDQGKTIEEMARAICEERNRVRLAAYDGDPEGLAKVKQSNLDTYGNENGPTPEYLYDKYGSWESVIQHAFSMNMGMDACCGLYDDNYSLYQELGLVD